MIDLKDFEYDELIEYLTSIGEKKFRAEQIFSWLHKGVESYDEMTNLSKTTREKLEKETEETDENSLRREIKPEISGKKEKKKEGRGGRCIKSCVGNCIFARNCWE